MNKNFAAASKIEIILDENEFFIMSESKVVFKNSNTTLSLKQISNSRLIKNRDYTVNILVLVFAVLFYLMVLQPLYLSAVFDCLIFPLILIAVLSCIKNYSYKLLINRNNYAFNEIIVSKKNLHFAGIFISKFTALTILKTKVKQEFEIDYEDFEKGIA